MSQGKRHLLSGARSGIAAAQACALAAKGYDLAARYINNRQLLAACKVGGPAHLPPSMIGKY